MAENTTTNSQAQNPQQLDAELEKEISEALGGSTVEQLMKESEAPAPAKDAEDADAGKRFEYEIKRGRISVIREDDVFVELTGVDGKNQGVVSLRQFDRPPRIGSIMDFVVERFDEAEGLVHLSREGAVSRSTWEQLQRGAVVEARVVAHNKGGLELEMIGGIRAFMPASQIELFHVDNLEQFVGQKFAAAVQEIDRKGKKVVLSRRRFLEQEREVQRKKIWETLEVGQTLEGTVRSVVEFGAFVDLGGVDGLLHISDMSYQHVGKPADVVQVGQKVSVKVLKLDHESHKVRLGLKQALPDPWQGIADRIRSGDPITGRVVRIADFGAFVEIEPGVEGLLPLMEISWKRIGKVGDAIQEGSVLRLKVLSVDAEKHRISLSLKQAQGDPWVGASIKLARGSQIDATVVRLVDFGAFVEVEAGLEGLVHISELADRRINTVDEVLKVGDVKSFRVIEVDEDNRRLRLSLKAPRADAPAEPAKAATPVAAAKPIARQKPGNLKGGMGKSNALGMGLGDLKNLKF
jgi:small subunit ribosomal protein S1